MNDEQGNRPGLLAGIAEELRQDGVPVAGPYPAELPPAPVETAAAAARRLLKQAEQRLDQGAVGAAQAWATIAGGWATLALTEPAPQDQAAPCKHPPEARQMVPVVDGSRLRKEWRCTSCGETIPAPAP